MSAKMIDRSDKLLPTSELRRLRVGSYEDRIEATRRRLRDLLGEEPFTVLATRQDEAIVHARDGFYRVALTEGEVSNLDVEVFSPDATLALVEREAEGIADLFIRGSVESARTRLENLVLAAPSEAADDPVSRLRARMLAPASWRRLFEARRGEMLDFLGDEAETLEEARLHPKLGKLYDGSIDEGNLDNYEDRVAEDLGDVLERLGQLRDDVDGALETIGAAYTETPDAVVNVVGCFAGDLLDDLRGLQESGSRVAESVDDIRTRGKLCDTLVEGLHDREVASRFVVAVANRMIEAS